MAYDQFILKDGVATLKGEGVEEKTVDLGLPVTVPYRSPTYTDYQLVGSKRILAFAPNRLKSGEYQFIVNAVKQDEQETYIRPIDIARSQDIWNALEPYMAGPFQKPAPPIPSDVSIEVGTVKGARRSRLNVKRRRTQRNRRNRKGRKLGKLTTRRR